jgi:hypothetical protein
MGLNLILASAETEGHSLSKITGSPGGIEDSIVALMLTRGFRGLALQVQRTKGRKALHGPKLDCSHELERDRYMQYYAATVTENRCCPTSCSTRLTSSLSAGCECPESDRFAKVTEAPASRFYRQSLSLKRKGIGH